jgi:hypothetical protein
MNERGQYGSRTLKAESAQCAPERGQYSPLGADARRVITSLALHVAGILLIGLGLAYLLIRWSGA